MKKKQKGTIDKADEKRQKNLLIKNYKKNFNYTKKDRFFSVCFTLILFFFF